MRTPAPYDSMEEPPALSLTIENSGFEQFEHVMLTRLCAMGIPAVKARVVETHCLRGGALPHLGAPGSFGMTRPAIAMAHKRSHKARSWDRAASDSCSVGEFMTALHVFFAPQGYSTGHKNHVAG